VAQPCTASTDEHIFLWLSHAPPYMLSTSLVAQPRTALSAKHHFVVAQLQKSYFRSFLDHLTRVQPWILGLSCIIFNSSRNCCKNHQKFINFLFFFFL